MNERKRTAIKAATHSAEGDSREGERSIEEEEENEQEMEIEAVYMRHIETAISSGSCKASPEPSKEMLQMYNAFSRSGYQK